MKNNDFWFKLGKASAVNEKRETKGMGSWFVKTMLGKPSTWVGLAVGGFVLLSATPTIGWVGGTILGSLAGLGVGLMAFLVHAGIAASFLKAKDSERRVRFAQKTAREKALLEDLRDTSLADDATLMEKLLRDRDAIHRQCAGMTDTLDAVHTAELVQAIGVLAVGSGESLLDLVRRKEDPHLTAPPDVDSQLATNRAELRQAYQALVDTRSRLRRGQLLAKEDIVAVSGAATLRSLTEQLQGETEVAELIEKRLRDEELLHGLHLGEKEWLDNDPDLGRERE